MVGVTDAGREPATRSEWARKYPPLLAMVVALLIALVVLPSALNLPQSNPTETLEYAPVPPDDESDSSDDGNLAALGLGSSSGIDGGGASGGDGPGAPPPTDPSGRPNNPNFKCVGNNPPRQTADPLSPPCVPVYEGPNPGATYQGVTSEEVRLLVTLDGNISYTNASDASNRGAPSNEIYDLAQAPEDCRQRSSGSAGCDHLTVKGLRVWQEYFNKRFQTYGRNIHFFVAFSEGTGATPERRRAEAAKHLAAVDPFAVVSFYSEGAEDAYLRAMAGKGVLNFGSFGLRPASFFNTYKSMIWSYLPSIEQQSASYISYVCEKVVNQPAVLADAPLTNRLRKIGLLHTDNQENHPGLVLMADLVKKGVSECGGQIADEATYRNCCLAQDNGDPINEEQDQMASFRNQEITTILWTGGGNGNYPKAAEGIGYRPEWILLGGDGFLDNSAYVFYAQASTNWDGRAIAVSPHPLMPELQQQQCYQYFREIDKNFARADLGYVCEYYTNLFQFMVGVQVAGEYLGPTQVDKGFHAIPQNYTGQPLVPACYYEHGDYTCIKDATVLRWSADATQPNSGTSGCFLAIDGGLRYRSGGWPDGNINAQFQGDDPCTSYSESVRVNLA